MTHLPFQTKLFRLINQCIHYLNQPHLPLKDIKLLLISSCLLLKTSALPAEKSVLTIDSLKDDFPIQQRVIHLKMDSLSSEYIPVTLQIGEQHTLLFSVQLPQPTSFGEKGIAVLPPKNRPSISLNNQQLSVLDKPVVLSQKDVRRYHLLDQSLSLLLLLYGFIYLLKQGKTYWQAKQKTSEEKVPEIGENIEVPMPISDESSVASSGFSMEDINWLVNLQQTVEQNMSNIHFDITQLANDLAISSRHLNRRIRQYTGFSTNQYIQETRLTTAKKLLDAQAYKSVKAVAFEVGYKDVKYFGQIFKKRFGRLPSTYFKRMMRG